MSIPRAAPTPQGIITINAAFNVREYLNRLKNTNSQFDQDSHGMTFYPFGNEKLLYNIVAGDMVFSYKGNNGTDVISQKLYVFANLNGIHLEKDKNPEDLSDRIKFSGVAKINYDVNDQPGHGLSVAISGVNRVLLNTDVRRVIYPGEYLMYSFPDISGIPRGLPRFNKKPQNKIIPIIRPVDRAWTKSLYSEIAKRGKKHGINELNVKASALDKIAIKYKKAVLTEAMRVVEILFKRRVITIDNAPTNKTNDARKLIEMSQTGAITADDRPVIELIKRVGVLETANDATDKSKSQLANDIFSVIMWPAMDSQDKQLYQPYFAFPGVPGPKSETKTYLAHSSETLLLREMAIDHYKSKISDSIIGKVLEPVTAENNDPSVDVLIAPVNNF
jgi:hypothetical protein